MHTIASWMSTEVRTVDCDASLREAYELMQRSHVHHLVVTDRDHRVCGVLSDRDVRRAMPSVFASTSAAEFEAILDRIRVGQVMTRDPVTAEPHDSLMHAARAMLEGRFSMLPVVADGRLLGVITDTDLLRALAMQPGELAAR